jgi:hypothetical protein
VTSNLKYDSSVPKCRWVILLFFVPLAIDGGEILKVICVRKSNNKYKNSLFFDNLCPITNNKGGVIHVFPLLCVSCLV